MSPRSDTAGSCWLLEYHEVLLIRDFSKISARKNGYALADRLDSIARMMKNGGAKTCHVMVGVGVEK